MNPKYVLRPSQSSKETLAFSLSADANLAVADAPPLPVRVLRHDANGRITALWGDRIVSGAVTRDGEFGEVLHVALPDRVYTLRLREASLDAMEQSIRAAHGVNGELTISSPIPGLVKSVAVKAGDEVAAGQLLIVLEAMKMENEIVAPHAGSVKAVDVAAGQSVAAGALLARITVGNGETQQ